MRRQDSELRAGHITKYPDAYSAPGVGVILLAALVMLVLPWPIAFSQCDWRPGFQPPQGLNHSVRGLAVFDDGSGPALYTGGDFTAAGGAAANHIAKWDGEGWSPLGSGVDQCVYALAVFDDGSGPALYAAGDFLKAGGRPANKIAKWDGKNWSSLGSGIAGDDRSVLALAVFDDGSGPALYAGGNFTMAAGHTANRIAKWQGGVWSPLGSGMAGDFPWVFALTVFDDGSGPALYAAGGFTNAGGRAANNIAKWDGRGWSAMGSGMGGFPGVVFTLAVFDDGSGPRLHAGGDFPGHIAKWDGSSWSPLGSEVDPYVYALAVFDDGSGPTLVAGGSFTRVDGQESGRIAKWDGRKWLPLGLGMPPRDESRVLALAVFDDGWGTALYAGGLFSTAGDHPSANIAKYSCAQARPIFHRGDPNDSGAIDIADGIYMLNYIFAGGGAPTCMESGDTNNSGAIDIADGIHLLSFLFAQGQPPPAPGPETAPCGADPDAPGSAADLGCASYTHCP